MTGTRVVGRRSLLRALAVIPLAAPLAGRRKTSIKRKPRATYGAVYTATY